MSAFNLFRPLMQPDAVIYFIPPDAVIYFIPSDAVIYFIQPDAVPPRFRSKFSLIELILIQSHHALEFARLHAHAHARVRVCARLMSPTATPAHLVRLPVLACRPCRE